jgi:hypothetical protein
MSGFKKKGILRLEKVSLDLSKDIMYDEDNVAVCFEGAGRLWQGQTMRKRSSTKSTRRLLVNHV